MFLTTETMTESTEAMETKTEGAEATNFLFYFTMLFKNNNMYPYKLWLFFYSIFICDPLKDQGGGVV